MSIQNAFAVIINTGARMDALEICIVRTFCGDCGGQEVFIDEFLLAGLYTVERTEQIRTTLKTHCGYQEGCVQVLSGSDATTPAIRMTLQNLNDEVPGLKDGTVKLVVIFVSEVCPYDWRCHGLWRGRVGLDNWIYLLGAHATA